MGHMKNIHVLVTHPYVTPFLLQNIPLLVSVRFPLIARAFPSFPYASWPFGAVDAGLFSPELYSGVEVNVVYATLMDREWGLNRARLGQLKHTLKKSPPRTVHAAMQQMFRELPGYYDFNLAGDHDLMEKAFCAQVDAVHLLCEEPRILVMHLPVVRSESELGYAAEKAITNLREWMPYAERKGIRIALENVFEPPVGSGVGSHIPFIKEIFTKVDSPQLGMCLDIGHANIRARQLMGSRPKLKEYLRHFTYHQTLVKTFGKKIIHAHLHYNEAHKKNTHQDMHAPLTLFGEEEREHLNALLAMFVAGTSLESVCLEVLPKKIFGLIGTGIGRATREDFIASARMVRAISDGNVKSNASPRGNP
ncbi:hypothetical protein COY95_02535 [Candidatus Woesearchaeota archaeon CG_4_10_14_0_8_um_filter_47_5]|nr:MAG: hypothetical protein COY95_02535 [Candidatus Woesearchaeota archaeon CG_4_10_14_0_8_um_filter_47_5]